MADEKNSLPQNQTGEPGGESDVTLEEFLVACQKSMARSVYAAEQAGKADIEFSLGERHFYSIDALDFDLSAAIHVGTGADRADKSVRLDFAADPSKRSKLSFRVETKPVTFLEGACLRLADLDPLGKFRPDLNLRIWLVNNERRPVPNYVVYLNVVRAGTRAPSTAQTLELTTDAAGRINFWFRARTSEIDVLGDKVHKLDLGGNADFFISATCDHPNADQADVRLDSEMLRMPAPERG